MSTSLDVAESSSRRSYTWPTTDGPLDEHHYRVAAFPAAYAQTDDVILRDERGHAYLLSCDDDRPTPIDDNLADSLGMFFEPSQDYSWHTVSELRRIIYGVEEIVAASH